jgi:uncharacterized protein (TIGR02996 family)
LDERDFLRAALESPHDPNQLLVAADWLDDNGQPLVAEYVRLCVSLSTMGPGQQRADALARLRSMSGQVFAREVEDRFDLLPRAVDVPRGRRTGDEYRLVGREIQRRAGGRRPWEPHEGDPPREVARQLLAQLARQWSRPDSERLIPAFYGDRTGRERMVRGQLQLANEHAYQLHAQARNGFHAPVRELRMSRLDWFGPWVEDAEQVVGLAERVAAAGHRAPGEDARSLAYLGENLHRLAGGQQAGLDDEGLMARAAGLFARLVGALDRMGAMRPPD